MTDEFYLVIEVIVVLAFCFLLGFFIGHDLGKTNRENKDREQNHDAK